MKRNYYLVVLIFLTFFVISFITNILGALNPDVIQSFNLSLTLAGLLPFAFFIAYGVMSIPSGMIVEKFKEKATMALAFIVAFLGALLFSIFPQYIIFLISLFLMGSGMAMLQVAINPLLRVSGGEEHFAFNSVMAQLIFGAASFIAPMFLTYLITNLQRGGANPVKSFFSGLITEDLSWTSLYWVFALIFLGMVVVIWISKFPAVEKKEDEIAGTWETHKSLFGRRVVILYFIGIFAYVGTEQGVSYWLSKFLYTYHNFDPLTIGAATVGRFWGMMSVGCLIGLIFLKLFDSRKILLVAVLFAATFLSIALFGSGKAALYAFPMVGFSLSVMWSIVFSLALNSLESYHGSFAGILCTAIIGGAIIQVIIGWLGDMFGLRAGMLLIYVTLAYIFGVGIWARPIITNETFKAKIMKKGSALTAAK